MVLDISHPMTNVLTFVDILTQRAQQQPEQPAYTFLHFGKEADTTLTYGGLDRQARSIASKLQSLGYAGKPVLLLYPSGLDYIAAFLGCLYAGAIAVPAYPPHSARLLPRLQAIINDTQANIALTTTQTQAEIARHFMQVAEWRGLHWIATDALPASASRYWMTPDLTTETLAFLQYTSGSTSTPKGVMVSHGNLLHNAQIMKQQIGLVEEDQAISWLPIFHDMGLILGILQPLYTGYHTFLMAPAVFLQRPMRWLQAISDYKVTTTCAPNFAYELCLRRTSPADRAQLDLRHWRLAMNGAEPVRHETLKHFSAAFAPCGFHYHAFVPGYGLAESTLMASSVKRSTGITVKYIDKLSLEQHRVIAVPPSDKNAQVVVSCGAIAPGLQVITAHPETLTQCGADEVGEIWIAGASVTQGYFGKKEATKDAFHAYLAQSGEGPFLRTGDLGFIQDGEIFVTGRLKDLIIMKGRNHYPQDIEYTVEQSAPIIRAGFTAAFSIEVGQEEQLIVVAEVRLPQSGFTAATPAQMIEEATKAVRKNIAEAHEITVSQIKFVRVGEVPKTSSGKLQRRECSMRFLTDRLKGWNE